MACGDQDYASGLPRTDGPRYDGRWVDGCWQPTSPTFACPWCGKGHQKLHKAAECRRRYENTLAKLAKHRAQMRRDVGDY